VSLWTLPLDVQMLMRIILREYCSLETGVITKTPPCAFTLIDMDYRIENRSGERGFYGSSMLR
jgi:hypothetical protein